MRIRLLLTLLPTLLSGCFSCAPTPVEIPDPDLTGPKTWYGAVGPLVNTRCSICHQTGDIAPFPLETYEQVKAQAVAVKAAVESKKMPPFPPDQTEESGCPRVDDIRRMSDEERKVLLDWLNAGLPAGEQRDLPPIPKNEPLGPPNDTWEMPEEYVSSASTPDDYRCIVIEPKVLTQIPVGAVSVKPGNRRVVHHSAVYLIPPDQMPTVKKLDADEPGVGYTCFGGPGVSPAYPTGLWVPGNDAPLVPPNGGLGYYLLPGWGFVVQQHYNYAAGKQPDKSSVVLWRANTVITEVPHVMILGNLDFTIPPNTMGWALDISGDFVAKGQTGVELNKGDEGKIYSVWGHMHQLGRTFQMDLVHADGSKECLLHIAKWDFNWQSIYKLKTFVSAKPGDKVITRCTWDNSRPTEVKYGENTSDEMCFGAIDLIN
jgi:hypothetical protein